MEKNKFTHITQSLAKQLQQIDYNQLAISDYNKDYIGNLKPALIYFMKIYCDCLCKGLKLIQRSPEKTILVDYGGGSGFLSILAKSIGFQQVIYLDLNPKSVETIKILKQLTGKGPDIILHGDSNKLSEWCKEQHILPDLLIATDLIEHVYNLKVFFKDLININPAMPMIFTTASTPFNPYVKHRLHKMMNGCENGSLENPNYYTLRKNYIEKNYPHLSSEDTALWAKQTRGFIYKDIDKAIQTNNIHPLNDKYNTCDPKNGNWAERILPIRTYRKLLHPYHYILKVEKGFYNADRNNRIISFICSCINLIIKYTGKAGLLFAPYIILSCIRQNK